MKIWTTWAGWVPIRDVERNGDVVRFKLEGGEAWVFVPRELFEMKGFIRADAD